MGRKRVDSDFVTEVIRITHGGNFWKFLLVFILISATAIGIYVVFDKNRVVNEGSRVGSDNSFLGSLNDAVSETFGDGVTGDDEKLVEVVDVGNSGGDIDGDLTSTESAEVVLIGDGSSETQSSPDSKKKTDEVKEKAVKLCNFNINDNPTYRVLINEVAWMGSESSANDEWIELKNVSGALVNLDGWQVVDKSEQIQVVLAGSISHGGFYLLERTDDNSVLGISADVIYSGALSNSDEGLRLFDDDCDLVDEVFANPDWPAGDAVERLTMQRESNLDWSTAVSPTPRSENGSAVPEEEAKEDSSPPPPPEEEISPPPPPPPPPEPEPSGKININMASLEELQGITGVGPVIAQRIIDYRNANGPFEKIEDIKNVSGIGDVTFEKMKDEITVDS